MREDCQCSEHDRSRGGVGTGDNKIYIYSSYANMTVALCLILRYLLVFVIIRFDFMVRNTVLKTFKALVIESFDYKCLCITKFGLVVHVSMKTAAPSSTGIIPAVDIQLSRIDESRSQRKYANRSDTSLLFLLGSTFSTKFVKIKI